MDEWMIILYNIIHYRRQSFSAALAVILRCPQPPRQGGVIGNHDIPWHAGQRPLDDGGKRKTALKKLSMAHHVMI
jgi:hypothetical protein